MRIRGIDDGFRELQQDDPGTALTRTALRRLVITESFPSIFRAGSKWLFDLDALESFLCGEAKPAPPAPSQGKIRPIQAR